MKSLHSVHFMMCMVVVTIVCYVAAVGEVVEADSSKTATYAGRIMPVWNQFRTACA